MGDVQSTTQEARSEDQDQEAAAAAAKEDSFVVVQDRKVRKFQAVGDGNGNNNSKDSNDSAMNNHSNHDGGGVQADAAMDAPSASSSSAVVPPMPWFGMDIGGTLSKLVYFEPTDTPPEGSDKMCREERALLSNIRHYLTKNRAYGESGHRDEHLQMNGVTIDGRVGSLHFIRFPTDQMGAFVALAKEKTMAKLASTLCATGGGAFKYQSVIEEAVKLKLHKFDEIDSLVGGLAYMDKNNPEELFYYSSPQDPSTCEKTPYSATAVFPLLLVNIGSGVSILSVQGPNQYRRVCGTSLGGGTFLGLCCLLTECNTFEEALDLASRGDNRKVDKLVRDIYGGDYERFDLTGDVVASSFGHMNCEAKRQGASKEDLARATLVTITNNIGSLARLCARNEGLDRVVFVGNFLRVNDISMQMLASAMDYWSSGAMKALFCQHEGYLGAIGCLLELMKTSPSSQQQQQGGTEK